jgi:PiT family inorganic phosphate transporter
MGLIMLILIGTVPTAYALNRALPENQIQTFASRSQAASAVIEQKAAGYNVLGNPRPAVTAYFSHELNEGTYPSLAVLVRDLSEQITKYGSLAKMPADAIRNTRNDMYLASEAIRFLMKDKASDLTSDEIKTLNAYKASLDIAAGGWDASGRLGLNVKRSQRHDAKLGAGAKISLASRTPRSR